MKKRPGQWIVLVVGVLAMPERTAVERHPLVLGPSDKPAGEIRLVFRPIARNRSEALVSAFLYCQPPQDAFLSIGDYFAMSALSERALREQEQTRSLLHCADSAATRAHLSDDNEALKRWRIEYTPTLFVEGRRVKAEAMEAVLASWGR